MEGGGAREEEEKRVENREQLLLLHPDAGRISPGRGRKESGEQRAVAASCILSGAKDLAWDEHGHFLKPGF
jgi:hypothetical protein